MNGYSSHLKINLWVQNQVSTPFIALWNPSCVCRSLPVYACIKPMYAYACMRTQVEGFLGLYFPKIDLFAHKKLYFSF